LEHIPGPLQQQQQQQYITYGLTSETNGMSGHESDSGGRRNGRQSRADTKSLGEMGK